MKKNKLILIIFLILIFGLLAWSITVYIPPIKGRVVDAETGKPLKGVNVRAGWVTGYADPGGGSFRTFKVYATKTDEKGEFVLPWTIKLKIPVIEIFQGIGLFAYEHGYVSQYFDWWDWRLGKKVKYYDVKLSKIKNDEEYNKNLGELIDKLLSRWLSNDTYKFFDAQYIIDEYKVFFKKYPNSQFIEENYRALSSIYEVDMKDYKSSIKVKEEFIKKFPNSPSLNWVKKDIQRLEQLHKKAVIKGQKDEK